MIRLFYLCFCVFLTDIFPAKAEVREWKLLREDKPEVVAFAQITIKNAGVNKTTDTAGIFFIDFSQYDISDSVIVSAMTFKRWKCTVKEILANRNAFIYLEPEIYETATVTINAMFPLTLMRKVIAKTEQSKSKRRYYNEAYYHQHHVENNQPVFNVESILTVAFDANKNKLEKFNIKHTRRSENKERNTEKHSDHLADLLAENAAYHPLGTVFNTKGLSAFVFQYDTVTAEENDKTRILFYQINKNTYLFEYGSLLIGNSDYRIYEYHSYQKNNPAVAFEKRGVATHPFTWKMISSEKNVSFKWIDDSLYLENISESYKHELISNTFNTIDFIVEEYFELFTEDKISFSSNDVFKFTTDLYSRTCDANDKIWTSKFVTVHSSSVKP